jgi:hypothetical protein
MRFLILDVQAHVSTLSTPRFHHSTISGNPPG